MSEHPTGKLRWRKAASDENNPTAWHIPSDGDYVLQQEWVVLVEEKDRVTGLHFQGSTRFEWRDVEFSE